MAFSSIRDIVTKITDGGQTHTGFFRKVTAAIPPVGIWFEGSMMTGQPTSNLYAAAPLTAANVPVTKGLPAGSNQSPNQKYIKRITATITGGGGATNLLLVDNLLYYPFIDGDFELPQVLDNTTASLQRYSDGLGVKVYLVSQDNYTGGVQFFFTYTNENGVSGRVSRIITTNTAAIPGSIASSSLAADAYGWDIPLQQGDRGIRSIESCQFLTGGGGVFALVLCKEIAIHSIREVNTPAEKDFLLDSGLSMPEIKDEAVITFLVLPSASISTRPIIGNIITVWG